jgi:hypothetical protein
MPEKTKKVDHQGSRGCSGIILGLDPSLRGTGIAILSRMRSGFNLYFPKSYFWDRGFRFASVWEKVLEK